MSRSSSLVGVVLGFLWGVAGCAPSTQSTGRSTGAGGASSGGAPGFSTGGAGGPSAGGTAGPGTGGNSTGTGGASSGGATSTGGSASGGGASGGSATGGRATGGAPTDGGVDAPGGRGTGGSSTGATGGRDGGAGNDAATDGAAQPDAQAPDAAPGMLPYKGVANSPCPELTALKASWFYNWEQTATACAGVEFVPMIWGHTGAEQSAAGITSAISAIVTRGGKTVLGFNEPDTATQSNMSVATAISLWPSFNNPAVRLGSPGTSANAAGVTWFQSFMSMVNADTTGRLRVDFLAVHWYGWNAGSCEPNAASLDSYLKQIEAIPGNRPIWITEWGCLNASKPDRATVQAFYSGAIAMFARHPRIERYAWYPWESINELYMNGAMTALGTAFAAAPSVK